MGNNEHLNSASILGIWQGKWGNGNETPQYDYTIIFEKDGKMQVFNGTDVAKSPKAAGEYHLDGFIIEGKYTYEGRTDIVSITLKLNDTFTEIDGTWNGGKVLLSKTDKKLADTTFYVALLGRQGILEFDSPVTSQPKSANLKLVIPNLTTNTLQETNYLITDGSWSGGIFTGIIVSENQPSIPVQLPGLRSGFNKIKLKLTTGTYDLIGAICYSTDTWVSGSSVIAGNKKQFETAPNTTSDPIFALVINDKHAEASSTWKYDHAWYIEPSIAVTDNFRMLTLLHDDVLNEMAVYAFDNKEGREEKDAAGYKIGSYNVKEILSHLDDILPSVYTPDLRSDLVTLLINQAQIRYPAKHLGFKSSGHGSCVGIMNNFFSEDAHIRKGLGWIKEVRGKNIDFLDFATNCNVASLYNLSAVANNVDYVLASDLTRGAQSLPFEYFSERPGEGGNYPTYFNDIEKPIITSLQDMLDKYDTVYNNEKAKEYITSGGGKITQEQIALFDMAKFSAIQTAIGGDKAYEKCKTLINERKASLEDLYYVNDGSTYYDFKGAIPVLYPEYTAFEKDWDSFVIKLFNNKRQHNWDVDLPSGMIIDRKYN